MIIIKDFKMILVKTDKNRRYLEKYIKLFYEGNDEYRIFQKYFEIGQFGDTYNEYEMGVLHSYLISAKQKNITNIWSIYSFLLDNRILHMRVYSLQDFYYFKGKHNIAIRIRKLEDMKRFCFKSLELGVDNFKEEEWLIHKNETCVSNNLELLSVDELSKKGDYILFEVENINWGD